MGFEPPTSHQRRRCGCRFDSVVPVVTRRVGLTSLSCDVGSVTDAVMYLYTLIASFSYPVRDPEIKL